jgi:hypothetical protein
MKLQQREQELQELENSVLRSEKLIFSQSRIVAELERNGQLAAAQSARALLRAFEKAHTEQVARREWLRRKLGW